MYIRKKNIRGRTYYYLVKSVRNGDQIRQICLEYIGAEMPDVRRIESLKRKHSNKAR